MICYDGEADQIYSFTDFEKAVASVEGSVRGYFGKEGPDFDETCKSVTDKMRSLKHTACIPMRFNDLQVVVYNWEIDSMNPIHKVLSECYDSTNDSALRRRIVKLFTGSNY